MRKQHVKAKSDPLKSATVATFTPVDGRLSKQDTRRGLKISIWEGVSAQVHSALTTSALLTGFALAWGANDFQLGLLGSIPFIAQIGQMLGAYLVDRWANRRREVVAMMGLLARGTWLLIAALPFMIGRHSPWVVPAILLVFFLYELAYCASGPGWVAWMAVLVPFRLRGRYIGRRNMVMEMVSITTALSAGWAIDLFRSNSYEREGFAVLQTLAGGMSVVGFLLLRRQPDPGHRSDPAELKPAYLLQPLKDVRFRWLIAFNVCWCFGFHAGTPFFDAHLLKDWNWDFKRLALLGVLSSLATVIMNPVWGRLADSHGHKFVLKLCAFGMLQLPLCYALCPEKAGWLIFASNFFRGAFLGGFTLALFSLTLTRLPVKARAMGAALFSAATAPANFLSGCLGGLLAQHLAGTHWEVAGLVFGNYQTVFLLSLALLVPAFILLHRVENSKAI